MPLKDKNKRKEYNKEYFKKYYLENKEKDCDRCKEYYRNNKERRREYSKTHYQNNKEYYKEKQHRYKNTKNGKLTEARSKSRRRRDLGFTPLFSNPFPEDIEVDYHHINNLIVIPIPRITHKKTLGKSHRKKCNKMLLKYYGLDLENLLQE